MTLTTFSEHESIVALQPFIINPFRLGLERLQQRGENQNVLVSELEYYCVRVTEKAGEIDQTFAGIKKAREFLGRCTWDAISAYSDFQYHQENFVLRMMGMLDRCYLLVGASFAIDSKKCESMAGRKFIERSLKQLPWPEVSEHLAMLTNQAEKYRVNRNQLIHSTRLSDKYLTLFLSIAVLHKRPGFSSLASDAELAPLWQQYLGEALSEFDSAIATLEEGLLGLIEALAPVHSLAITK